MASGHAQLGGFECLMGPGMILAWLFTKGDNFTSDAEHALYGIPFSLLFNVAPAAVLGAVLAVLVGWAKPTTMGNN
jgi:hypothetical protein